MSSVSAQDIMDCLKTNYGIHVETLTFLPLSLEANTTIYKAEKKDHTSYFLKVMPAEQQETSTAILELLQSVSVQQIIAPIKTIQQKLSQRIDNFTLVVYPYIEGKNGFECLLTKEQWQSLGDALRQIHAIEVPAAIKKQLRHETYSPKWREKLRSIITKLEKRSVNDETSDKLIDFIKQNMLDIQRLINHPEALAQILAKQSHHFVLCHADIHAGNILLDKNNKIYIVDWNDVMMAPKERDLMFIGGGVGNTWNNSEEIEYFYQGYGKAKINQQLMSYYRHERIVEDMAIYADQLLFADMPDSTKNREDTYKLFISMFEPNGVVDIAFKTDSGLII